jgi:Arc/MetJ-type ribon-helix-helix transcriptional regulator
MPESMAKEIDLAVKEGRFASKSEFVRGLVRDWTDRKMLVAVSQSRKEMKQGKGKVLRSLKDLE